MNSSFSLPSSGVLPLLSFSELVNPLLPQGELPITAIIRCTLVQFTIYEPLVWLTEVYRELSIQIIITVLLVLLVVALKSIIIEIIIYFFEFLVVIAGS